MKSGVVGRIQQVHEERGVLIIGVDLVNSDPSSLGFPSTMPVTLIEAGPCLEPGKRSILISAEAPKGEIAWVLNGSPSAMPLANVNTIRLVTQAGTCDLTDVQKAEWRNI